MKHTRIGRIAALAGITVLAVAACSTPAATTAPASAPASPAAGGAIDVGYLPKDIVNPYFAAAKTGVDKAAGELGGTVTQVGPNEARADLQIPFITLDAS